MAVNATTTRVFQLSVAFLWETSSFCVVLLKFKFFFFLAKVAIFSSLYIYYIFPFILYLSHFDFHSAVLGFLLISICFAVFVVVVVVKKTRVHCFSMQPFNGYVYKYKQQEEKRNKKNCRYSQILKLHRSHFAEIHPFFLRQLIFWCIDNRTGTNFANKTFNSALKRKCDTNSTWKKWLNE